MTSPDGDNEFEDFLARRSPLLQRMADRDRTEPPPELDRIVLTKAREAIEAPSHQAMYRSPRWALPVALAATIVISVAVTFDLYRSAHRPSQVVAQSKTLDAPAASIERDSAAPLADAVAPPLAKASGPTAEGSVALAAPVAPATAMARQSFEAPPPAELEAQAAAGNSSASPSVAMSPASPPPPPPTHALAARAKRIDAQAWLAQIERLRADGKVAEADEQLAEYRKAFPRRAAPSAAAPVPPSR